MRLFSAILIMTTLFLFGCASQPAPAPTTQPSTQPTVLADFQAALTVAQTAYNDAQPYIAVAAALDPSVGSYNAVAGDALTLASGGSPAALADAITKVQALVKHPAIVKAKAIAAAPAAKT